MKPAPIIVFAYKRTDHLKKILKALQKNPLAAESDLIVFSDGPKSPENKEDIAAIHSVRELIKRKQWCKNTRLVAHPENRGLNNNFFDSIKQVMDEYGKAIIVEDDILVSPHFLQYMNDALNLYENEKQVFHINGYTFNMNTSALPPTYFLSIPNIWGWATWKDRWDKLIRDPKELLQILTEKNAYNQITLDGAQPDFWHQLVATAEGKMNIWDIRWYCTVVINNGLCLYPKWSLVENIGFDGSGIHFRNGHDMGFKVKMGSDKINIEKQIIEENTVARKEIIKFFSKYKPGIFIRIKEKLYLIFTGKLPQ